MPNAMNINDPAELAAEYKRFYEMRNSKKNNNNNNNNKNNNNTKKANKNKKTNKNKKANNSGTRRVTRSQAKKNNL